ncbi:phasin family protein [Chrysiogenes arsenatis]|uniref:phasin family protein n=1 Tax=Chrysiogenes arsenatis TaxID=309797 RepID=UPI000418DE38|nr:phasin family protein [Chrysiogenes arsenatis]
MEKKLEDLFLFGLGAALLTKEKIETAVREATNSQAFNREEAEKMIETVIERGKAEKSALHAVVRDAVRSAIDELGIATKEDLERLRDELKSRSSEGSKQE